MSDLKPCQCNGTKKITVHGITNGRKEIISCPYCRQGGVTVSVHTRPTPAPVGEQAVGDANPHALLMEARHACPPQYVDWFLRCIDPAFSQQATQLAAARKEIERVTERWNWWSKAALELQQIIDERNATIDTLAKALREFPHRKSLSLNDWWGEVFEWSLREVNPVLAAVEKRRK